MSDWAREKAGKLLNDLSLNAFPQDDVAIVAQALRVAQRETAEECYKILNRIQGEKHDPTWQYPIVCCKDAIRERFLKEGE